MTATRSPMTGSRGRMRGLQSLCNCRSGNQSDCPRYNRSHQVPVVFLTCRRILPTLGTPRGAPSAGGDEPTICQTRNRNRVKTFYLHPMVRMTHRTIRVCPAARRVKRSDAARWTALSGTLQRPRMQRIRPASPSLRAARGRDTPAAWRRRSRQDRPARHRQCRSDPRHRER